MLGSLRAELGADFVVVNGENAAGGIGITPKHADELFGAGADVITLGNHTYRHREVWPYLEARRDDPPPGELPAHAARPRHASSSSAAASRSAWSTSRATCSWATPRPALLAIDDALREVRDADHVLVDMHAEATSEKVALGWYLDGKVTAVVGTHTHVPTADARVLPGGTAYITDVGMTGARGGVIGVKREQSIAVMRTHMPQRYDAVGRRPVDQRGAHPLRRAPAGDVDRAGAAAGRLIAASRASRRRAEVLQHHGDDVAQRPLVARRRGLRPRAAPQQRAERVDGVQRAVRAAADVVRAPPVEELVARLGRREHLAGRPAAQRRPHPAERVG